jgi:hypothetical protein
LEILAKEKPTVLGIGIRNDMYTSILEEFPSLNLSAYQFCCEWCMSWVGAHTKSRSPGATVEVVFESGQKFASLWTLNWAGRFQT